MKTALATLLALLLACPPPLASTRQERPRRIAVMGSSVAAGWVTSHETRYDMRNGWAFRLERLLAPRGWSLAHLSVPGDSTERVLERMEADLASSGAGTVIVALSLGNEGLADGDPEEVCARFELGLEEIVERCRELGLTPVVGLCYGSDHFGERQYSHLKRVNLLLHTGDVPTINFLGAMDDGHGHFPDGCTYDLDHPDDRGHEELFLAVPPGLFDALEAGKPRPVRPTERGHVTVAGRTDGAPLSWVPADLVHPFALSFSFRTGSAGTLAAVILHGGQAEQNERGTLELDGGGALRYVPAAGQAVGGSARLADGEWHHVVLSHRHLAGETLLFVDGELQGRVAERLEPLQIVLGGDASGPVDLREWMVHRSALNGDEARALNAGELLEGSLEVYAPLGGVTLQADAEVANLARSSARVFAHPTRAAAAREALAARIAAAAEARANEPVFEEPQPIEVDPALLESYAGRYRSQFGFLVDIRHEEGRLYFARDGEPGRTELFGQTESCFFVKFPLEEITLTFHLDGAEAAQRLVMRVGDMTDTAERVE